MVPRITKSNLNKQKKLIIDEVSKLGDAAKLSDSNNSDVRNEALLDSEKLIDHGNETAIADMEMDDQEEEIRIDDKS